MKSSLTLALLLLHSALPAHSEELTPAEEETQIVTTCHYANAEWGTDMIHLCVEENRRVRAEVLALPEAFAPAVKRCRTNSELGWNWVKACVMKDASVRPAPAR